jgi:hypothetical protein
MSGNPDTIAARVQRGAMLLDNKYPGWAARVNPEMLRMSDCGQCVLGQLFGHYHTGLLELRLLDSLSSQESALRGFCSGIFDYAELGAAWRIEITARRQERSSIDGY